MAGNKWGTDDDTNKSCLGCGVIQEVCVLKVFYKDLTEASVVNLLFVAILRLCRHCHQKP